jgi:ABC-2 type transport system ATP-binding protein
MPSAIEVRGLRYRTRGFSIDGIDLSVPEGSIYGFLGPNGAGKTTTIRLMLGMTRPAAGSIRLLGHEVPGALPQALQRTGYVPERPHLYRSLTVDEAVRFHAAFFPSWDASWAAKLRGEFALPGDRRISRLSKGEHGKLAILLALAQRPGLLVLDEPTDGLDPMIRRDVTSAVLDYVADTGATVFISSHLVHELERICDWVGVLDRGRLVAEMPIAAFKDGIKRIRVSSVPSGLPGGIATNGAPFSVLSRTEEPGAAGETWIVRGWDSPMAGYIEGAGATVREVADLDLEEVFVELLRSSRETVRS